MPQRSWVNKNYFIIFRQNLNAEIFTPPAACGPLRGEALPGPPGDPPWGGPPRKRGRPSPAEFPAKIREKGAEIGLKWGFLGVFRPKNAEF